MKIKNFECPQCGSHDFDREEKLRIRCAYCKSLYETSKDPEESGTGVTIKKGAKVTFGKNAKVTIRGGLKIEEGAEVEFNGTITLLEKSDDESIELAKKKLKQIKEDK